MAYTIEQKIKGKIYLYEVENRWDPEKKQARQKRRYLGRKDEESGGVIPPRHQAPRISSACEYGHLYVLETLAEQLELTSVVRAAFGEERGKKLLGLMYFQILEGKPLYLYKLWSEELLGIPPLSSQQISRLLHTIGSDDHSANLFFQAWAAKQKPLEGVWLDITSLSSYSAQNHWVEPGYNRDQEDLPQVNLGVLMGNSTQLPFFYQLYPGSIVDVSTLTTIGLRAKHLGFDIQTWVMDRGFYSASNLKELEDEGYSFITAMPQHLTCAKMLLSTSQKELQSPVRSFCLGDETLFYSERECEVGSHETVKVRVCIYLSEKRKESEMRPFISKLEALEDAAKGRKFKNLSAAVEWVEGKYRGMSAYYTLALHEDETLVLSRKKKALAGRINRMGKMIMVTNRTDLTPKELLEQYRRKDKVEKVYDILKNTLHERRLRVHSTEVMQGKMFITFLSLILQTALTNKLSASSLAKTYTVPELLMELGKIRLFLHDGYSTPLLSEISKKQRSLLAALSIPTPNMVINSQGF